MAKQATISGTFGGIIAVVALATGVAWTFDVWSARGQIHQSELASCQNGDTDCAQKDLPAQIRAAAASEAMVDIAVWQTLLSALGIGGLLFNLYLTRAAVKAATDAAEGTDAGIAVAREHMTTDLRAWLLMNHPTIDPVTNIHTEAGSFATGWMFSVVCKNEGRTPALDVSGKQRTIIIPINQPNLPADYGADLAFADEAGPFVGPGIAMSTPHFPIVGEDARAFSEGQAAAIIHVKIRYRTIFDREWRWTEGTFRIAINGNFVGHDGHEQVRFDTRAVGVFRAT